MDLKNGYKVIYDVAKAGKRNFYASKTGVFADAEPIAEGINIGDYKLIYEKNGMFYGSTERFPTENDYCFEEFNKVFVEETTTETSDEDNTEPVNQSAPEDYTTVDPDNANTENTGDETGSEDNGVEPDETEE